MARILKNRITVDPSRGRHQTSVCLFCNVSEVALKDWNKRCAKCREKQRKIDEAEQKNFSIGQAMPAAVITTEDGTKVFVDKFGREVPNPGYDLENDPRGWSYTRGGNNKKTVV